MRCNRLLSVTLVSAFVVAPWVEAAAQAVEVTPRLVSADGETVPVSHSGDAADDPAIWVHPTNPSASLIIGNDKGGALESYNLDGSRRQSISTDAPFWGNVDVRQDVTVDEDTLDVVATTNGGLRMFTVDPSTRELRLITDGSGAIQTNGGEGLCLYDSPSGDLYAFSITRPGQARQYRIHDADGDDRLEAILVRSFAVGSEAEGCVADESNQALYISEEDVGLWRYGAEPGTGETRVLVDAIQPEGRLAADVEGVTVVRLAGGTGYVIASAQNTADPNNSYFAVYDRQSDNAYRDSFRIQSGNQADSCERTDGITAYAGDLGPLFPQGLFVCQDNNNRAPGTVGYQNFKLVRLEKVVDLGAGGGGNQSPTASFTTSCSDTVCTFDASTSTDPDGSVDAYAWDFGDGTSGAGVMATHAYEPGTWMVRLTVTDRSGATANTSRPVNLASGDVSFVGAASSNANRTLHTVQVPENVAPGDALLLFAVANAGDATVTGPTGWTLLRQEDAGDMSALLWTRVATDSDAGSTVPVTASANVKADLTLAAYRGAAAELAASGVDTSPATMRVTPPVTVGTSGSWVLSYWAARSTSQTTWTLPQGETWRSSTSGSGGGHITAALTDSGASAPIGPAGELTGSTSNATSVAVMFTVVLAPADY